MNELVGFLTILLFCLLKLNKHLKNKSIPKTAKELEQDKKSIETQEFFDNMARHGSLKYDYLGQNINNDD